MASIHEDASRTVRIAFRTERMHKGDPVDVLLQVGQHTCDPFATLASGHEGPGTPHEIPILTLETEKIFLARASGSPSRFSSSGLCSQRSTCEAAPGTKDLQHALCAWQESADRSAFAERGARRFTQRADSAETDVPSLPW